MTEPRRGSRRIGDLGGAGFQESVCVLPPLFSSRLNTTTGGWQRLGRAGKIRLGLVKTFRGFHKTMQDSEKTLLGFGNTFQGFRETMQGSETTLLGFENTFQGFRETMQGSEKTLLGFGNTFQGFRETMQGSETTLLGFGNTFQGFRETMQGSEKNLLGFGKTRRLFRGLGLGLTDFLLGFGRRLPGGRNFRRDVGTVLPGSGDSLQEVAFSCPPFETQAFHSGNGLTADGGRKRGAWEGLPSFFGQQGKQASTL